MRFGIGLSENFGVNKLRDLEKNDGLSGNFGINKPRNTQRNNDYKENEIKYCLE